MAKGRWVDSSILDGKTMANLQDIYDVVNGVLLLLLTMSHGGWRFVILGDRTIMFEEPH